jgi:hypothetical protein
MSQFNKLKSHLENNGVKVEITTDTNYVQPTQTINIHHRYNMEVNGLYALLHEAGHWLQNDDKGYTQNLKNQFYKNMDNDIKTSMIMFMHELDAWNRGEQLSNELNIEIDKKLFEKSKQEALLTYYVSDI